MAYPAPPLGWVHTWLRPLYDWLVGLLNIINSGSAGGAAWKPVRVLTAAALPANTYVAGTQTKTATANGTLTVDGVLLAVGDRFWDKDAVTGSERGLFVVTAAGAAGAKWAAKRADDAKASADYVDGKTFDIAEGTQAGQVYQFTTNAPFVLDTDTPTIARETGVMHTDDNQTVTGVKTFADGKLKQNNAAGTFATLFATLATAARTWTLPDVSDTAVGLAATQTLTNKTLTSPILNSPQVNAPTSSAAGNAIADPGNAGAIPVGATGVCNITSAGAETRTLAIPAFIGQVLDLCMDTDGGDVVVTVASAFNQAGNTTITFNDAGDFVRLVGCTIGGTRGWRLAANDGATLG